MRTVRIVSSILGVAMLAACSHAAGSSPLPAAFAPPYAALPNTGSFKVLYSFKGIPDGMSPAAGMTVLNGELYGTTQVGGQADSGTVFVTSTAGKESVLYSFGTGSGPDGVFPVAGLVMLSGTFYGTATSGGAHGFGVVFKIDKSGTEHVLYSFKGGNDGAEPYTALVADKGALYGTTLVGGGSTNCQQGCGTIFEVTTAGVEHVVHSFKGGSDGASPLGRLLVVNSALYGTTSSGGKNGAGTIFKHASGKQQVLHSFGGTDDGADPEAGLAKVGEKFYGTTNVGGKNGDGTVFATNSTGGNESVLYSFKGGSSDGENPEANVISLNGKLYGTTAGGGTANLGTVFSVSTSGSENVVHAFKTMSEGSDPRAPLVVVSGMLYGTTSLGGANGVGTIFKTSP
ncbi:MAG: choice-of-anchor tandem repeat GloVer-containing protein [Candidatus Tumulicola sp.]